MYMFHLITSENNLIYKQMRNTVFLSGDTSISYWYVNVTYCGEFYWSIIIFFV